MKRKIRFISDGLSIVGNLYYPENFDKSIKYKAILVGGSWTTVKEQMSGLYAEELSKHGFITLAIDPKYFGESEGQPRFWENPSSKINDYKNAITYICDLPNVDKNHIYLTAICASAGYMSIVTTEDSRVKGLATVASWLHDYESVKTIYGGKDEVEFKINQAKKAKKKFAENGRIGYIPTISKIDPLAAMYGDFSYYLDSNRGAIPEWSADKFAIMSWEDWLLFNPMESAKSIQVPCLMIHSEDAALPNNAKKFFLEIPHIQKTLYWTKGTQFDFYDNPIQVQQSVAAISVFFNTIT